jgi:serine/threonine-protein kinase RsbW
MSIRPVPEELGALLQAVATWAAAAGVAAAPAGRLGLVVDELAANVVAHGAARQISVAVEPRPGALRISVADDGRPFDPLALPPPDTSESLESRQIGGLGVHLVRRLARSLAYAREAGWNRVTAVVDGC